MIDEGAIAKNRRMHSRLVNKAKAESPKTKKCPHCGARKDVETGFGFRTTHEKGTGKPLSSRPHSWCKACRSGPRKS